MSQRITIRAFIKKDNKMLLLRRADGRQSILGKYELPGGRVEYGEQPEDSLSRHLKESTGLTLQAVQLKDVVTYIDHDDRDIQYAVIVYEASLALGEEEIVLSASYDQYEWIELSHIQREETTELSRMLLDVLVSEEGDNESILPQEFNDVINTSQSLTIYSDGGSRGNPGPSAAGYVVMDESGKLLYEGGSYLGLTTNNQAEYHGVRLGLEKARELGARSVEFRIDSLLVVNQLNGAYVIRNRELWPIHERIRVLAAKFEKITFRHVKREFNQHADRMVNKILDEHAGKKV